LKKKNFFVVWGGGPFFFFFFNHGKKLDFSVYRVKLLQDAWFQNTSNLSKRGSWNSYSLSGPQKDIHQYKKLLETLRTSYLACTSRSSSIFVLSSPELGSIENSSVSWTFSFFTLKWYVIRPFSPRSSSLAWTVISKLSSKPAFCKDKTLLESFLTVALKRLCFETYLWYIDCRVGCAWHNEYWFVLIDVQRSDVDFSSGSVFAVVCFHQERKLPRSPN